MSVLRNAVYDFLRTMPWDLVCEVFYALSKERGHVGLQAEGDGSYRIGQERTRQIVECGFDAAHDDHFGPGMLSMMAISYASPCTLYKLVKQQRGEILFEDSWPFEEGRGKLTKHGLKQRTVIAGALLAAEVDRMERRHT